MSSLVESSARFAPKSSPSARPWLQHDPAGVPADVEWTRYRSCVALFD